MNNQRKIRGRLLPLAALAILAGGCGSASSAGSTQAASAPAAGAVQRTCQQVSAVLSDGPDPGADPVGYAEAQILPLRQIHAADARLGRAITALADAYRSFSASDGGSRTAKNAVAVASKRINGFCPGAAS
jgi:hypothetical protein